MLTLKELSLYLHTIKYLKIKQILYRIYYKCYKPSVKSNEYGIKLRKSGTKWTSSIYRYNNFLNEGSANFLNHQANISNINIWNDISQGKLWLYNLHYFEALLSNDILQRNKAYKLLSRWIDENPFSTGIGWEPYPTSLRITNIIKFIIYGNCVTKKELNSLYLQARHLNVNCEYHLLGNHLFENLKALCFAGCLFGTVESKQWLEKGIKGINEQIIEQILTDGGHFELSPMYHCIILEGLLDLKNIFNVYNKAFLWNTTIEAMLNWLSFMQRPNNEISYFNDAANSIAATPQDIFKYASKLGFNIDKNKIFPSLKHLKQSGYVIYQHKEVKLIADVGEIGASYLPGHAHADSLSFEMYFQNAPVIVNLGTSCYGISQRRQFERSTSAHNTVEINEENSSEVWSSFRVARRAYPKNIKINQTEKKACVQAQHNGYERLRPKMTHQRSWCMMQEKITIEDIILGNYKTAKAFFYFAPNVKLTKATNDSVEILLPNKKKLTIKFNGAKKIELSNSQYATEFGLLTTNCCIIASISNQTNILNTTIDW